MAETSAEQDAFDSFRARPSPERLIHLLRVHQDWIFRLCFHVLRRPHDAEDAAQEVLLKIADSARRFDDSGSFRKWLYRVSLNAALEAARKSARRRAHESRAPMRETAREPLDDEARRALFEGIARLDDASRALLLDHYFEGETLESLASRSRTSASAVWKRIERAREELRRAIPVSALAALPDMGRLFERGTVGPGAPDLVSGAVLAKVQSVAAALAAEGVAMTSKNTLLAAVAFTALICLAGGTGLGVLMTSRADRAPRPRAEGSEGRLAEVRGPSGSAGRGGEPVAAVTEISAPVKPVVAEAPGGSSLAARLGRYRAWMRAWEEEKAALGDKLNLDDQYKVRHFAKKRRELCEELEGMRDLILADPRPFLDFLRAPENAAWLDDLIVHTFSSFAADLHGFQTRSRTPFAEFPTALTRGLLDLLHSGTSPQKGAAMSFFGCVSDLPREFEDRWCALLEDPDPGVQKRAAQLVAQIPNVRPEFLDTLMRVGRSSGQVWVRTEVVNAMSRIATPEAQDYLLERLETATDGHEVVSLSCAMMTKFYSASSGGPAVPQEKFLQAAAASLNRGLEDEAIRYVIHSVLFVPPDKARPVLERARTVAATAGLQDAVTAMLRKIDAGVTRREELEKILWPAR